MQSPLFWEAASIGALHYTFNQKVGSNFTFDPTFGPTFGSFTLLEPVSHFGKWFLW
jgi:hypothetical protein